MSECTIQRLALRFQAATASGRAMIRPRGAGRRDVQRGRRAGLRSRDRKVAGRSSGGCQGGACPVLSSEALDQLKHGCAGRLMVLAGGPRRHVENAAEIVYHTVSTASRDAIAQRGGFHA